MSIMDGTETSESDVLKSDMSYLYSRDPSIIAYGQRPFLLQESKKNLYSLLEEEQDEKESTNSTNTISTNIDTSDQQTIKVFLRMKPFPQKMILTEEQKEAYTIVNSTTLLTKMPSLDNNTSCLKKIRTNEMVCRNFIFTQTFDADTSQLELFEQAVKPQMVDFLAGKNSIVMSYGTTNSGKTYTLQGTPESPGLIPRGIEFVFGNVNPQRTSCFKPMNFSDVIYLNSKERTQELEAKIKLLALNPTEKNAYISTYNRMQQLLYKESPVRPNPNNDAQYSVWISFAEIYNETIYDLLWNDCHKKRPALKLATDSKGRTFIKGLRSVCVSSGAEAYQVLMAGQYNLKVAATALNSRSSRSHCIFTIKLLKYKKDLDPQSVDVSMFAFCDLAGSERLKKTLNVGDRLKEAQNINTSLLVLGRCLKTIYEFQSSKQKNESIGPFRESKLTRLFQRALSGKEQIALIVNVNPVPNLYDETQNVLNFSAIAKKIVIERIPVKRRRSQSKFSRLVTRSIKNEIDWENTELEDASESAEDEQEIDIDEDDDHYEELIEENEMLKKEIKELKASIVVKEMKTRQELTEMYSKIMNKLETDWKNRMTDMEEQQEDLREIAVEQLEQYYKDKLNQMSRRKRSRSSFVDDDDDDDKMEIEELEIENNKLNAQIKSLKAFVRDLKRSKEEVESEKTKISFELAVAKEEASRANEMLAMAKETMCDGDDAVADYVDQLLEKIKSKDERIKTMKTFLSEAKEEYISITDQAQKMEVQIKKQEIILAENIEHIKDLEEQLNQANAYSSEQNKVIENLEEELEHLTKKLIEAEEKARTATEKLYRNLDNADVEANVKKYEAESEETKKILEDMKLKLELSEKENEQLKEKLNERVIEIESLTSNLDSTKSQLDKVTCKISDLSIDEKKRKADNTVERGIQTKDNEISFEKVYEVQSIETDEKWQQTSFSLNTENEEIKEQEEILKIKELTIKENEQIIKDNEEKLHTRDLIISEKDRIIHEKDVLIQASNQATKDLELMYKDVKELLETYKTEKLSVEKQFHDKIDELQCQIRKLSNQLEDKNNKILTMQKELEAVLENAQKSASRVQELTDSQDDKFKELMVKIEEADQREKDKDKEISDLQKELKCLIRSKEESLQKMESETKTLLQELIIVKEQLKKTVERHEKVEKDNRDFINELQLKISITETKLFENESLKSSVDELKKALIDSEQELEKFKKNRDEMMSKYEDLVKSQRDELDRLKIELKKYEDLIDEVKENAVNLPAPKSTRKPRKKQTKNVTVDVTDNTSDDDHTDNTQMEKKKSKAALLTPARAGNNFTLIELSGSETNQSCTNTSEQAGAARTTRRKKLFTPLDDSFIDIDQSKPSPSPNHTGRSLRNRRK